MHLKLCCALLAMTLLTSCAQVEFSPENLMRPPKLTQEQMEISTALEEAVGDKNIKYKYPESGDYRSSFVFYDLDGDGETEALAFYQAESKGSSTWLNILDRKDGQWVSVFDMASPNQETNIDFISFQPLTDKKRANIVVGWANEYLNDKSVVVYSYEDQNLTEEFDQYYSTLSFVDINSDSQLDLVLASDNPYSDDCSLSLVTRTVGLDGKPSLEEVSTLELAYGSAEIVQMVSGKVDHSTNALFIDSNISSRRNETTLVTQVVTAYGSELLNLLDSPETSLSADTIRSTSTLCQDIDGDGIMEIPVVTMLPGYSEEDDSDILYLTTFQKLGVGSTWSSVLSCAINEDHRYMMTFPDTWKGNVTIVSQPESGEWTFIRYNGSLTDTSVPLLRIRVYSAKDYHDKFESEYFELLGMQGLFEYYAYIPENQDPLRLSQPLLKDLFSFIK